jgi:hypothetical protein
MGQPRKKLVIVGGAQSSRNFLDSLERHIVKSGNVINNPLLALDIDIIEAGKGYALGPAWNEEVPKYLTMNAYDYSADPTKNAEVTPLMKAVQQNPNLFDLEALQRAEISRAGHGLSDNIHYDGVMRRLRRFGMNINIIDGTMVTDIQKEGTKYSVITKDSKTFAADFVTLATGHSFEKNLPGQEKGIFKSQWPAADMQKIDTNEPVAIMGAGLSAVDAMLVLAHKAGKFERVEGKMVFTPHAHSQNFKLTAYSHNGMLPSVLGYEKNNGLIHIQKDMYKGIVSLNDFWDECRREAYASTAIPKTEAHQVLLSHSGFTVEKAHESLSNLYHKKTAKTTLHAELEAAVLSRTQQQPLPLQSYLQRMQLKMEMAYNHFNAEDQQRFVENVQPHYKRRAHGMVIGTAEQILALMEAGRLEVKAAGKQIVTSESKEGEQVTGVDITTSKNARPDHYKALVMATGDRAQGLQRSSELMKNLFASGMVSEMLTEYQNSALGKEAFERKDPEFNNTRLINGKYYRAGGGLAIDMKTFKALPSKTAAVDPNASNELYAMGPPVVGHLPLLQGMPAIEWASYKIINSIENNLKQSLTATPPSPPPAPPKVQINVTPPQGKEPEGYVGLLRVGANDLYIVHRTGLDAAQKRTVHEYGYSVRRPEDKNRTVRLVSIGGVSQGDRITLEEQFEQRRAASLENYVGFKTGETAVYGVYMPGATPEQQRLIAEHVRTLVNDKNKGVELVSVDTLDVSERDRLLSAMNARQNGVG